MTNLYVAAIIAMWTAMSPNYAAGPERLAIATAIATINVHHAGEAPLFGQGHLHDALVEAFYSAKESENRRYPHSYSWDSIMHVSCGFLQEPCAFTETHRNDIAQAAWWYDAVKSRGLESVDSSPTRAHKRVEWVTHYLEQLNGTATDDVVSSN
jgi:hypothetical protein